MTDKEIKLNQDDIKAKAKEKFEADKRKAAEDAAIEAEVKRLHAEDAEKTRKANEQAAKESHDQTIKGIRQFHGNVMRKVSQRYSADSKPMYVDKGV